MFIAGLPASEKKWIIEEMGASKAIVGDLMVRNGLISEEVRLANSQPIDVLMKTLGKTGPIGGADFAPARAGFYYHQKLDWAADNDLLSGIGLLLKSLMEDYDIKFDPAEFQNRTGVSLPQTVQNAFSNELTFFGEVSTTSNWPYFGTQVKLKSPDDAKLLFDSMTAFNEKTFIRSDRGGNLIYYCRSNDFTLFIPTFTLKDDQLLMANGIAGIKYLMSKPADEPKLKDNELFVRLMSQLPQQGNQFIFVNYKVLAEAYLPFLRMVQEFGLDVAPIRVPTYYEVEPYVTGQAIVQTLDGNDIIISSIGDIPALTLMNGVLPGWMVSRTFPIDWFDLSTVGRQPGAMAEEGCAENLLKIHSLLNAWAKEHDGAYPPDLDAIADPDDLSIFQCPHTLSPIDPEDVTGTSDYYYFRDLTTDEGDLILLVDRLPHNHRTRNAVLASGMVLRSVHDDWVELAVKKYNEAKGALVAFEGGVVY
jgi:hypothetical protein